MKFKFDWDADWFENRLRGREETFRFISDVCRGVLCKTVLDVGGGTGLLRRFLPEDISLDVIDLSSRATRLGKDMFPDVQFQVGTIHSVSVSHDAVVALSVIEHLPDYQDFFKAAWEKANRVVMVTFHNGLDDTEVIKHFKGCTNYWENKYSLPKMMEWIRSEINPPRISLPKITVDRNYSPEPVLILRKE